MDAFERDTLFSLVTRKAYIYNYVEYKKNNISGEVISWHKMDAFERDTLFFFCHSQGKAYNLNVEKNSTLKEIISWA